MIRSQNSTRFQDSVLTILIFRPVSPQVIFRRHEEDDSEDDLWTSGVEIRIFN